MAGEGNPSGYAITISTGGVGTAGSNSIGMSNIGNTSGTSGAASGAPIRYIFAGGNNITLSQSVVGGSGTLTISAFNQTVQTQNLIAASLAGNTSGVLALISSGTLSLAGGNNITLSQAGNVVTISAFNQTVESQSAGISNLGNTAGTSGIASGANVRFLLAGGNNVTLSQSVNGASGTVSIAAGGTLGQYWPYWGSAGSAQYGNGTVQFFPMMIPEFVTATQANFFVFNSLSTSSNSSFAGTISVHFGIYTNNASTLSLASSGSTNYQWTNTSDNSAASLSLQRMITIPINVSATPGNYWGAFVSLLASANANWLTMSNVIWQNSLPLFGVFAAASTATIQWIPGMGQFSASSVAVPVSASFQQITGTATTQREPPVMNLVSFSA